MNRNIKARSLLGGPSAALKCVSMRPRAAGCEGIGKRWGPDAADRDVLHGRVSLRRPDENPLKCRYEKIEDPVLSRRD